MTALQRADPLSKESYRLSVRLILKWEQARGPNPPKEADDEVFR
jgi:hypothetical protein